MSCAGSERLISIILFAKSDGEFYKCIGKPEEKIHPKLSILQKRDLYLNQFSNKRGAIGKPERPKMCPIWAAHSCIHLFHYDTPRSSWCILVIMKMKSLIIGSCIISLSNSDYKVIQKTIHVTIHKSSPWRLVQRSRITKADRRNN